MPDIPNASIRHADANLLRVEAVAAQCSVSAKTIRRWIASGLSTYRMPGAGSRPIVLIRRNELTAWLEKYHFSGNGEGDAAVLQLGGRRLVGSHRTSPHTHRLSVQN